jgi:hypothetical protein
MELHPNDRPSTIEDFRQFLIGTRELPTRPVIRVHSQASLLNILKGKPEQFLLWLSAGLLIVSLVASLIH